MNDYQKALAAARELYHNPEVTYSAYWFDEYHTRLSDLLAAIDAQKPVAWFDPGWLDDVGAFGNTKATLYARQEYSALVPLYAAPPAAVVPALEVFRIAGGDTECTRDPTADQALDCLRDLRQCYDEALQAPPAAVPDGCALVPVEPTEAMLDVMHDRIRILCNPAEKTASIQNDREVWAAMLAAAQGAQHD